MCSTAVSETPLTFQQKLQTFLIREYYVPKENIVQELVAGLVVGLAVVPEAIAFALVVGILPQVRGTVRQSV
jgi:MFS superfamily sulfate permease-like transporter